MGTKLLQKILGQFNPPTETSQPSSISDAETAKTVHTSKTINPLARKAEARERHDPDEVMYQVRCSGCNGEMWTWSKREDICERCGWDLRDKYYTKKGKQKNPGGNAFDRQPGRQVPVGVSRGKQLKINPLLPTADNRRAISPMTGGGGSRKVPNPFK